MEKPNIALVLEGGPAPKKGGSPSMRDMDMDDEEPVVDEPDIEVEPEHMTGARAVMTALKAGDEEQVAKALKGFIKLCGGY